jgi:hypothetical protein
VPSEIRSEYLTNISQEFELYASPIGEQTVRERARICEMGSNTPRYYYGDQVKKIEVGSV